MKFISVISQGKMNLYKMYHIVFKACLYSKYKLNLNFLWSAQR